MKRALIVGSEGQDGQLLFQQLEKQGYEVTGIARTTVRSNAQKRLPSIDIDDPDQVKNALHDLRPDEVYFLAAYHFSSEENQPKEGLVFRKSYATNVLALVNFLEAIAGLKLNTRIFYASSSHIFGQPQTPIQDESTPFSPSHIYGITKLSGLFACRYFREQHGVFASVGVLYNHESHLRSRKFLSMRIIETAIEIAAGLKSELIVGNLDAKVDWGYAPDYVRAMQLILALPKAEDFVIATGTPHTVKEFIETTFELLGLSTFGKVREERSLVRNPSLPLVGNPARLQTLTDWKPSVDFRSMIAQILKDKGAKLHA